MSVLVIRKNGENISYSGSQYEGLENIGTHHLCINKSGVTTKYGLTSTPLDDKYKALKMRISNNSTDEVKYAYIAQRYNETVTDQSSTTYTSSSISNYISSTTLSTASKTQLSTKTTTRASNYVSSQTLLTASSTKLSTVNTTRVSTHSPIYYGRNGITSLAPIGVGNTMVLNGSFLVNASSSTTYSTYIVANVTTNAAGWNVNVTVHSNIYTVTATQTSRVSNYVSSSTLITNSSSKLSTKNTTRASTYTSSQTLSTASSTKLSTGNVTRSSEYSTSSSTSTTSSILKNNVNL